MCDTTFCVSVNDFFWDKAAIRCYVANGSLEPIGGWNEAISIAMYR
jgi:hypothetical protein